MDEDFQLNLNICNLPQATKKTGRKQSKFKRSQAKSAQSPHRKNRAAEPLKKNKDKESLASDSKLQNKDIGTKPKTESGTPSANPEATYAVDSDDDAVKDAIHIFRKQEKRLAQIKGVGNDVGDRDDEDPANVSNIDKEADDAVQQARRSGKALQQTSKKSSRSDLMYAGASKHSSSTINSELFGQSAETFAELGLSQAFSEHLSKLNYNEPTSVQKAVLPLLMKGRDVLVKAPTGTGKTLAYLAPMIQRLGELEPRISRSEGCRAIIVTPTRELTLQVYNEACALAKRYIWLVPGMLIGGENRHHEKQRLRKGVVVLVATPGRLLDHLESTTAFSVSQLQWLVLDEADRLLDLGFQASLSRIVELLSERSTMSMYARYEAVYS